MRIALPVHSPERVLLMIRGNTGVIESFDQSVFRRDRRVPRTGEKSAFILVGGDVDDEDAGESSIGDFHDREV